MERRIPYREPQYDQETVLNIPHTVEGTRFAIRAYQHNAIPTEQFRDWIHSTDWSDPEFKQSLPLRQAMGKLIMIYQLQDAKRLTPEEVKQEVVALRLPRFSAPPSEKSPTMNGK